jgi:hypothetical protein
MKLGLVSGTEFIKCFNDHILSENEEYTLPVVLASLQWILHYKLDKELENQAKNSVYETLYKKLSLCKTKSMEVLIVQDMLSIMSTSQDKEAIEWLKS